MLRGSGGGGKAGGGAGGISEAPDSLSSRAFARFVDLVAEGPISGLVNGEYSIYLNGIALRDLSGTPNYRPFRWDARNGEQNQTPIPGFTGTQQENVVSVPLTVSAGPIIRPVPDADADAVRVTVSVNGLSQTTSDGKINETEVEYLIRVRVAAGTWFVGKGDTISGKTGARYQRQHEIDLASLGPGPYEVSVERVTPDSTSGLLVNNLFWDSYTVINYEKLSYPNSALVGVEIDSRYFSQVPERAYHVRGLLIQVPQNYDPVTRIYATTGPGTTMGAWDGTFKIAYSNNPAWCFYDLMTDERYGLGKRISAAQIDKWEVYKIGQYCDGLVPTADPKKTVLVPREEGAVTPSGSVFATAAGGSGMPASSNMEPRFTLNCVINTREDAYRVVTQLVSVFRGMAYWGGGSVILSQDKPGPVVASFTNANVEDGEFKYEGSGKAHRHTVAHVGWNDPAEGFKQKFVYVEDREGIARYGVNTTEIVAFGCTSLGQARRVGLWTLLTERLATEGVSFRPGFDASFLLPGDVVEVLDSNRVGARWGGRVKASTLNSITTDAPETYGADTYTLSLMMPDGTRVTRTVTFNASTTTDLLTFTTALPNLPVPLGIWTMSSTTVSPFLCRVVSIRDEDDGKFTVTALEHVPGKFAAVDLGAPIERPNYTLLNYRSVTAVTNLTAVETTYRHDLLTPIDVRIDVSWDAHTDPLVRGYVVRYVGAKGTSHVFPEQTEPTRTLSGLSPDTYTITVVAINHVGVQSLPATVIVNATGVAAVPQDLTVPPAATGLTATPKFASVSVSWDQPSYTQGGGNKFTRVYAADYLGTGPLPVFGSANIVFTAEGYEHAFNDPVTPGTQRHYWLEHVTRANVAQAAPSGGVNGVSALVPNTFVTAVTLVATSFVFKQAANSGPITPTAITLTAIPTGAIAGQTANFTTTPPTPLGGTGNTRTLSAADLAVDQTQVKIDVSITYGAATYTDTVTIFKLLDGGDGISFVLTNEAHTVPADAAGNVTSFAGAETFLHVFEGATDVTSSWVFSKIDYGVSSYILGNNDIVVGFPAPDPQIDDVVLLLHGDESPTDPVPLDVSLTPHTFTKGVGATFSTTNAKWGRTIAFDGSVNSWAEAPLSAEFDLAANDFAIQQQIYVPAVLPARQFLMGIWGSTLAEQAWALLVGADGKLHFDYATVEDSAAFTFIGPTLVVGQVNEIGVARSGTQLCIEVNNTLLCMTFNKTIRMPAGGSAGNASIGGALGSVSNLGPGYPAFVLSKSPAIYLNFKQLSGDFQDQSPNNRDGVVTGTVNRGLANLFPASGDGSAEFVSTNAAYVQVDNPNGNITAFNTTFVAIWRGKVTSLAARNDLFGFAGLRVYVTTTGRLAFDWTSPNDGGSSGTVTSAADGLVAVGEEMMVTFSWAANGGGDSGRLFKNSTQVALLSAVAHLDAGPIWIGRGPSLYGNAIVEGFEWYFGTSFSLGADVPAHYTELTSGVAVGQMSAESSDLGAIAGNLSLVAGAIVASTTGASSATIVGTLSPIVGSIASANPNQAQAAGTLDSVGGAITATQT